MTRLRAHYPARVNDTELWFANVSTYWAELDAFRGDVLRKAFRRAWRAHVTFFPSCGELEELCRIAEKDTASSRPQLGDGGPEAFDSTPASDAARKAAMATVAKVTAETRMPPAPRRRKRHTAAEVKRQPHIPTDPAPPTDPGPLESTNQGMAEGAERVVSMARSEADTIRRELDGSTAAVQS
ncbi:hypothetical protein LCGC14_1703560 [marine sediment metagenome]|uniref:Uncharacterized protein n=1 Tax=marine sediment metagenome TaxID=412755 RepID=A0A0F9I4T6_9ZZZZ